MKAKIIRARYLGYLVGMVVALFILSTTCLPVEAKPNGLAKPEVTKKVTPKLEDKLAKIKADLEQMDKELKLSQAKEKLGETKEDLKKLEEKTADKLKSIDEQINDFKDKGGSLLGWPIWLIVAIIAGLAIIFIALLAYWRKTYIKGLFPPIK